MLALALTFLLVTPPTLQEAEPPSAEVVEATVKDLKAVLAAREREAIFASLERAHDVPAPAVVDVVWKAVASKDTEVQLAALSALRWIDHPKALSRLEKLAKDKKRMKVEAFAVAVLKGLGQHAQPSSVPLLGSDPSKTPWKEAHKARIMGLGRIRTKSSVEALFKLLSRGTPRGDRREMSGQLAVFRLSLTWLTGQDHGTSPEAWERWWRSARKGYKVPSTPPVLPKELKQQWYYYWGLERDYDREVRREDRGSE